MKKEGTTDFADFADFSVFFNLCNLWFIFIVGPMKARFRPETDEISQKLLEVQKPFLEKVSGRRRLK